MWYGMPKCIPGSLVSGPLKGVNLRWRALPCRGQSVSGLFPVLSRPVWSRVVPPASVPSGKLHEYPLRNNFPLADERRNAPPAPTAGRGAGNCPTGTRPPRRAAVVWRKAGWSWRKGRRASARATFTLSDKPLPCGTCGPCKLHLMRKQRGESGKAGVYAHHLEIR